MSALPSSVRSNMILALHSLPHLQIYLSYCIPAVSEGSERKSVSGCYHSRQSCHQRADQVLSEKAAASRKAVNTLSPKQQKQTANTMAHGLAPQQTRLPATDQTTYFLCKPTELTRHQTICLNVVHSCILTSQYHLRKSTQPPAIHLLDLLVVDRWQESVPRGGGHDAGYAACLPLCHMRALLPAHQCQDIAPEMFHQEQEHQKLHWDHAQSRSNRPSFLAKEGHLPGQ